MGYDNNNPLIGLPTEIDATNTDQYTPSGIKDAYFGNSGDKILLVGGAYNFSVDAGLWLSDAGGGSGYVDDGVGSRLIRHQTSGGREVANLQTSDPGSK